MARNHLFVALLWQGRAGRARDDGLVRKDARQVRPTLDLPMEPLKRTPSDLARFGAPACGAIA
jgi:hypothetical protein